MLIVPQIKTCSHDTQRRVLFFPLEAKVFIYLFSIYPFDKFEADSMGNAEHDYTRFATVDSLLVYYTIEMF